MRSRQLNSNLALLEQYVRSVRIPLEDGCLYNVAPTNHHRPDKVGTKAVSQVLI